MKIPGGEPPALQDPGPRTPTPAVHAGIMIVSTWFLLYGLACAASAAWGGLILSSVTHPSREGMGIDGGLGAAIAIIFGASLVGLGLFAVPHLWLALQQFRTGRFRAGWSRGVSLVNTLLWVLVSMDVSSPRGLVNFFFDNKHPWAISVAVGITLIHGGVAIVTWMPPSSFPSTPSHAARWITGVVVLLFAGIAALPTVNEGEFVFWRRRPPMPSYPANSAPPLPPAPFETPPRPPSLVEVTFWGFIQQWLVLGPIPLPGDLADDPGSALDREFLPDQARLKPTAGNTAQALDSPYVWRSQNTESFFVNLGSTPRSASIAMSYVWSELEIPAALLWTGSDDSAAWYLNGEAVQRFVGGRAVGLDQERTPKPVFLAKGVNTLIAIVVNGGGPTAAAARFSDMEGRPLFLLAGAAPVHSGSIAPSERRIPEACRPIQGPLGHWKLDGDANEATGNLWDGESIGGTWTEGKFGKAIALNGIRAFVDLRHPILPAGRAPRSLCAWARSESLAPGYRWIASWGTPAGNQAMFIGMRGTHLVGGGFGGPEFDVSVADFWDTGRWHHIALTYDGVTARLYADGTEKASAAKHWSLTPGAAYIGKQVNGAEYWNGLIDDVMIHNRALSADEVRALASRE